MRCLTFPLKVERWEPRFVPDRLIGELSNLWHTSKIPCGYDRYKRMCQAAKWFHDAHPDISITAAYKDLDSMLTWSRP
jgi:hypothetical protein